MKNKIEENKRATRGKRIRTLIGEEAEADEEFWGQEAWNIENDDDYTTEEENPDQFDSDFNESEDSDDEPDEVVRKESKAKKSTAYKEPSRPNPKLAPVKTKKEKKTEKKDQEISAAELSIWEMLTEEDKLAGAVRPGLRASTREKTALAKILEEEEAQQRSKIANSKKKKLNVVKGRIGGGRFSQEELLKEAVLTEVESAKWLENMRKMAEDNEENTTERSHQQALVRWISKRGQPNTVSFLDSDSMPEILRWAGRMPVKPVAKAKLCVNSSSRKLTKSKNT